MSEVSEFFSVMKIRNHTGKFYGAVSEKIHEISQIYRAYQANEKMLHNIRLADRMKIFMPQNIPVRRENLYRR